MINNDIKFDSKIYRTPISVYFRAISHFSIFCSNPRWQKSKFFMHHDLVRNSNSELPIRSSEVMNFLYLGDMDDRPLGIRFFGFYRYWKMYCFDTKLTQVKYFKHMKFCKGYFVSRRLQFCHLFHSIYLWKKSRFCKSVEVKSI